MKFQNIWHIYHRLSLVPYLTISIPPAGTVNSPKTRYLIVHLTIMCIYCAIYRKNWTPSRWINVRLFPGIKVSVPPEGSSHLSPVNSGNLSDMRWNIWTMRKVYGQFRSKFIVRINLHFCQNGDHYFSGDKIFVH